MRIQGLTSAYSALSREIWQMIDLPLFRRNTSVSSLYKEATTLLAQAATLFDKWHYKILGYGEWRNFNNVVIKRAMKACEENKRAVADHFVRSYKAITGRKGAKQQIEDVLLHKL